ncbi:MAG: diadenylate cyclase CdaA [Clostridiaceae bacterium]
MDIIKLILTIIVNITIWDVIDIFVVSYIFYKIYKLIYNTRAVQLLKGILLIIILIPISSFFNLTVLNWILNETITIGVLSIVIIFQPEIRRALEHIGRSTFYDRHILENEEKVEKVINEIVNAVENMAKTKTGALIIIEQTTGLEDIILTGTKMDAMVSASLIENIFFENTPLHDGATVIRNDRILAAGCFLPLSTNSTISKKLGTRHRAGIGISENSDALTIVVSEETGVISLAVNGKLTRNYTKEKLKDILLRIIRTRFFDKKKGLREKVKLWMKLARKTS